MRLGPRSPGTTGVAEQRDFQQQALETVARETWTPVTRNHGVAGQRDFRQQALETVARETCNPPSLQLGHQEQQWWWARRFPATGLRNSGQQDPDPPPPPPAPPSHTHNSPSQVARNHGVEGQRFLTTALRNSGQWDLDRTPPQQPGHQVLLDKDSRLQHLETVARKTWRPSLSDHQEHYGVLQGREVCVQKQPLETQDSSPYSLKVLPCFPARSSGTPELMWRQFTIMLTWSHISLYNIYISWTVLRFK